MPIPWLVVLQAVPWTDVIRNAPKVADGAKKLWLAVSKKIPRKASSEPIPHEAQSVEQLQARLDIMEAAVAELQVQMMASSELIKSLAEQNGELIKRVEKIRIRVRWLTVATIVLAVFVVAGQIR